MQGEGKNSSSCASINIIDDAMTTAWSPATPGVSSVRVPPQAFIAKASLIPRSNETAVKQTGCGGPTTLQEKETIQWPRKQLRSPRRRRPPRRQRRRRPRRRSSSRIPQAGNQTPGRLNPTRRHEDKERRSRKLESRNRKRTAPKFAAGLREPPPEIWTAPLPKRSRP